MRISDWSSDVCSSDLHDTSKDTPQANGEPSGARTMQRHGIAFLQATHLPRGRHQMSIDTSTVINEHKRGDNDTGSPEVQVALLRSEEHTSELQSLMRISYAVFCLKNKQIKSHNTHDHTTPK